MSRSGKAVEWILLSKGIRGARAHLTAEEARTGAKLQQARLLAEVMRRVAEPAEALPPGNRAAVILTLARQAVAEILAATTPAAEPGAPTAPASVGEGSAGEAGATDARAATPDPLAVALERAPAELLVAAAPDAQALASIKASLLNKTPGAGADSSDDERQAARVRAFVETLLWNADAPRRNVDRLLVLRLARLALVAVVLALIGLGIYKLSQGKNLIAGKPFKTSSSWSGCATDPTCDGVLVFHTNEDNPPWVEYDLLKPTKIHRVRVKNRSDCCTERIAPLVIESSMDAKQWTELGRKKEEFATWDLKFPAREARYLRLRIDRRSTLHVRELLVQ